jgi:hexosaminidase
MQFLLFLLFLAAPALSSAQARRPSAAPAPAPTPLPLRAPPVSGRGPMRPTPPPQPRAPPPPLSRDGLTDARLWPAPVSETHAGEAAFARRGGDDVAAVSADCPFAGHLPDAALPAQCTSACAADLDCNAVNHNPATGDCVARLCADPNAPALSAAPGYTVWTTNSTRLALAIDARAFTLESVGPYTDADLQAALARYALLTFPYGPGAPAPARPSGAPPPQLLGLRVSVAGPAPLSAETNETYALHVGEGYATLAAPNVFAALRGLETFSQLVTYNFSARAYAAWPTDVLDFPRFSFRAVMLDTSRHFLTLGAIEQVMEAMSMLKLNVLHLHLTDDNSFPVVVAKWPRLAAAAAYSNFSHTYSAADLAGLAEFGRARGIRLIPEFDTPAHFSSLFPAYPEFAAAATDPSTNASFLCLVDPTKEATFSFLADVWGELAAAFPGSELMIGGDEAWGCWADSPAVAAWMRAQNYSVAQALHYYERRMIGIARGLGRRALAWLDIAGWPLANESWAADYPDVTLNVWTGCYSGNWAHDVADFTALNGTVVVSGPFYITQQNGAPGTPHFTWQQMHQTDLANFTGGEDPRVAALVQGGELCAWGDAARVDSADLLVELLPYMIGVAEAWWSPRSATSGVAPDEERAHVHRCRLIARGLPSHPIYSFGNFCPTEWRGSNSSGAAWAEVAAA